MSKSESHEKRVRDAAASLSFDERYEDACRAFAGTPGPDAIGIPGPHVFRWEPPPQPQWQKCVLGEHEDGKYALDTVPMFYKPHDPCQLDAAESDGDFKPVKVCKHCRCLYAEKV